MEQQAASATVLVVEDFDDTRRMMRQFLESGGYRVVEASDGREAVETARRTRPALVLMDLNLPVLDGFTATLRIREDEQIRHTPVIAVTAYDTPEFRAAAKAVGCDEYVAKPLDFDKLMTLLERLIPNSRARTGEAA